MNQDLLSVVIPTFGGQASLEPLLSRLRSVLNERGQRFEVVVVNDGSPDDTWTVLKKLIPEYPELHAIDLLHNHNQATATMCGLFHAGGSLVATMDDDLQHPPEELGTLLDALEEHPDWDAVVGCWPRDQGLWRNLGSWIHQWADRVANGTPRGFRHTGFRIIRRSAVDALIAHQTRTPVVGPLLKEVSSRVQNVQVAHHPRPYGRSGFLVGEGAHRVMSNFLHGTALPLRILSQFGMFCSAFAVVLGLYFFTRWALGYATPSGWASSFLAIVFFGGASLFGIGILGEYTHVLLGEARQPPRWAVREQLPRKGAS